jgi:hypothetical protein
MKAIEMKSHLKSQNKSESKQNREFHANNKRLRNENSDDMQLMTVVIADSEQKKARSAKDLSHIVCYTCDKAGHYKPQHSVTVSIVDHWTKLAPKKGTMLGLTVTACYGAI